jgi:transposase
MSLRPQAPPTVPEETRRVARAAFPKGTLCLRIADALGPVYQDQQFATLFPRRGKPAEAPGRLALAVVLQFVENLSDRDAARACPRAGAAGPVGRAGPDRLEVCARPDAE